MSLRELPERPNLEHLKNQARTLLRERLDAVTGAAQRFSAQGIESPEPKLADALHVIAKEYGFATWPALKLHLELQYDNPIEAPTTAMKANDAMLVRDVLTRNPSLKAGINEPLPNY